MIKRFITWLYIRYVVAPEVIEEIKQMQEGELEIEFTPEPELEAMIQSMTESKH